VPDEPREFEILPAAEMQRKYGLYAENYPPIHIDPADVPGDLHDLIPLAERFGVTCDITRHDLGDRTSQADKDDLTRRLRGRHDRINEWLNTLPIGTPNQAAGRFTAMCLFELEENAGPGLKGDPQRARAFAEQARRDHFDEQANAPKHHAGPPCPKCGQPLRTAKARQCFRCGAKWHGRGSVT
jgi:hypothetical protein